MAQGLLECVGSLLEQAAMLCHAADRIMSDNVVSLRGAFSAQPAQPTSSAQPNSMVIQELERLLAAARAGEIIGMAGAYVHQEKVVTYSYAGAVASYGMLGGLDCVKERLLRIVTRE